MGFISGDGPNDSVTRNHELLRPGPKVTKDFRDFAGNLVGGQGLREAGQSMIPARYRSPVGSFETRFMSRPEHAWPLFIFMSEEDRQS
jgi:hypothetical protein